MKKFFLFSIFFVKILSGSDYQYFINLTFENKELLEVVKIGSFRFITGKTKYNEIKIFDEKSNECEIIGVNFSDGEMEVFFKLSDCLNYNVFLGYKEGGEKYKEFKKGEILIDDYLPPNSVKSGVWLWGKKSLSGIYSHLNKEGFLFHRANFSKQIPITSFDKIVGFLYIEEEKSPEEIIVEVIARGRRHYYFSFGEDRINIKGINKEKIGEIPEKGKWVKIEIPLSKIQEKFIEGMGFYNDKGKVFWDRFSLNDLPVESKIKKVINLKDKNAPYFIYEIEGPFKIEDKKFTVLKLDATISLCEEYRWEIDGKVFNEGEITVELEGDKKEVEIKLKGRKENEEKEFSHKINLQKYKEKEVKVIFNILPFENFVYDEEIPYISLRIENMTEIPLNFDISYPENKIEVFLFPGKENGKTLTFPVNLSEKIEINLLFYNNKIRVKKILTVNPEEKDYHIDGIFLKKEDTYLIFKIPEYLNNKNQTEFSKIYIFGDFPAYLVNFFEENGIKTNFFQIPDLKYVNYLMYEFNFVQKNVDYIENNAFVIFFPFLNSILKRHKIEEWKKVHDTIFYLLIKKTPNLLVISPFPSYPVLDAFKIYRDKLKEIAEKRNLIFLDLYEIYSKYEGSEKFFKINEYVYRNMPDEEGSKVVFEEIINILNQYPFKIRRENGKTGNF